MHMNHSKIRNMHDPIDYNIRSKLNVFDIELRSDKNSYALGIIRERINITLFWDSSKATCFPTEKNPPATEKKKQQINEITMNNTNISPPSYANGSNARAGGRWFPCTSKHFDGSILGQTRRIGRCK